MSEMSENLFMKKFQTYNWFDDIQNFKIHLNMIFMEVWKCADTRNLRVLSSIFVLGGFLGFIKRAKTVMSTLSALESFVLATIYI